MDSANKQTAVVAEVTQGTTPSSPAFKLLRDSSVSGSPQRGAQRSPERLPNRQASHMVSGLASFPKTINLPFARDAGTDILLEALFCSAWGTDVLKVGSTKKPFTLEEKYEGGATDPYRRLAGCLCDSLRMSFPLAGTGDPGTLAFAIKAMTETTATAALGSSTYAAPTPDEDPVSSIDIIVNDLFGITTPKIMSLDMTISNAMREQYAFGSANPFGIGLGQFTVNGQVQIYFGALADYSTFVTRQTGLSLDLTIGSVEDSMDLIQLNNVDVWNPDVSDPGPSGDNMVTLNFEGRYDASDLSAIMWTRNYGLVS
jgi:hypothetical protein